MLTGLGMSAGVTYGSLESLNIGLGGGGDTFTVGSTHVGETTVSTHGGADTVNIQTIAGDLTLNAGAENDDVTVAEARPPRQ